MYPTPLIETETLASILEKPNVKVIDATWYLPPTNENAYVNYQASHIPGAVFFDIDAISDQTSSLPHMLPTPEFFAQKAGELGIQNADYVVIYDAHGLMSAARVWWMFRFFGHDQVAVLNGGFPKWKQEGYAVESGIQKPNPTVFEVKTNSDLLSNWQDVQRFIQKKPDRSAGETSKQILDVRSAGRFLGQEAEPRAGLRSGHIPESRNVPWMTLLHSETKTMLPSEQLRAKFKEAGLNPEESTICSCGSGITACIGLLALNVLGNRQSSVYDGSWAEWGSRTDLPIEMPVTSK